MIFFGIETCRLLLIFIVFTFLLVYRKIALLSDYVKLFYENVFGDIVHGVHNFILNTGQINWRLKIGQIKLRLWRRADGRDLPISSQENIRRIFKNKKIISGKYRMMKTEDASKSTPDKRKNRFNPSTIFRPVTVLPRGPTGRAGKKSLGREVVTSKSRRLEGHQEK
jgi:hypothetical protein